MEKMHRRAFDKASNFQYLKLNQISKSYFLNSWDKQCAELAAAVRIKDYYCKREKLRSFSTNQ